MERGCLTSLRTLTSVANSRVVGDITVGCGCRGDDDGEIEAVFAVLALPILACAFTAEVVSASLLVAVSISVSSSAAANLRELVACDFEPSDSLMLSILPDISRVAVTDCRDDALKPKVVRKGCDIMCILRVLLYGRYSFRVGSPRIFRVGCTPSLAHRSLSV